MRHAARGLILVAIVLSACGCTTPQWHTGDEAHPLLHEVEYASVFTDQPDTISVTGEIIPSWMRFAVTDYGIKVNRAEDDTGRTLALRSFQIFWMKVECFEAVFTAPAPAAKSLNIDFVFTSRSGVQRIVKTLPIRRDVKPSYITMPQRWEPSPNAPDLSSQHKTKA